MNRPQLPPLLIQTIPKGGNAVQHFVSVMDKAVFIEFQGEIQFLQFFLGMGGMLAFQPVMPDEKSQRQVSPIPFIKQMKTLD